MKRIPKPADRQGMQSVSIAHWKKGILHIETPLGIINIHVGLANVAGSDVESVVMIPSASLDPKANVRRVGTRFIRKGR